MPDLFLIAHKVRGEPAFDIAVQMPCPECEAAMQGLDAASYGCTECDGLGFWWIIPTSGHRAYPFSSIRLDQVSKIWLDELGPMPSDLPDHYRTRAEPKRTIDVAALTQPVIPNFVRRF